MFSKLEYIKNFISVMKELYKASGNFQTHPDSKITFMAKLTYRIAVRKIFNENKKNQKKQYLYSDEIRKSPFIMKIHLRWDYYKYKRFYDSVEVYIEDGKQKTMFECCIDEITTRPVQRTFYKNEDKQSTTPQEKDKNDDGEIIETIILKYLPLDPGEEDSEVIIYKSLEDTWIIIINQKIYAYENLDEVSVYIPKEMKKETLILKEQKKMDSLYNKIKDINGLTCYGQNYGISLQKIFNIIEEMDIVGSYGHKEIKKESMEDYESMSYYVTPISIIKQFVKTEWIEDKIKLEAGVLPRPLNLQTTTIELKNLNIYKDVSEIDFRKIQGLWESFHTTRIKHDIRIRKCKIINIIFDGYGTSPIEKLNLVTYSGEGGDRSTISIKDCQFTNIRLKIHHECKEKIILKNNHITWGKLTITSHCQPMDKQGIIKLKDNDIPQLKVNGYTNVEILGKNKFWKIDIDANRVDIKKWIHPQNIKIDRNNINQNKDNFQLIKEQANKKGDKTTELALEYHIKKCEFHESFIGYGITNKIIHLFNFISSNYRTSLVLPIIWLSVICFMATYFGHQYINSATHAETFIKVLLYPITDIKDTVENKNTVIALINSVKLITSPLIIEIYQTFRRYKK